MITETINTKNQNNNLHDNFSANDKCEKIINSYLMLDKNEKVPFYITMHLLRCKNCRRLVKLLSMAEKATASPLSISVPLTDKSIKDTMKKIAPEIPEEKIENPISMKNWISSGIVMIVFMLTIIPMILKTPENSYLLISFCTVFGLCVTVYCIMFVISNMDFFIKKMETKTPA